MTVLALETDLAAGIASLLAAQSLTGSRMRSDHDSNDRWPPDEWRYQVAAVPVATVAISSNDTRLQALVSVKIHYRAPSSSDATGADERSARNVKVATMMASLTSQSWWRSLSSVKELIELDVSLPEVVGRVLTTELSAQVYLS